MKNDIKSKLYGILLSSILLLTSCTFIFIIADSRFLTAKFILIISAVLLLICIGVFFLCIDSKKKVRTVIGTIIAVITIILMVIAGYYIHITISALKNIAKPKEESTIIGIYVRKEDPAGSIADIKDYSFGILHVQSRLETDFAIEKISKELNKEIETSKYQSITEISDAIIKDKEIDVMVVDKSFIELLDDTEGHGDDIDKIRELYSITVTQNDIKGESSEDDPEPQIEEEIENKDVFTMYISGNDCFGSIMRKSRSDVNILATVNTKTGQVLLISTPRDFYVPLSISDGVPDKLTHAGIYGINVSVDTIGMLYNTKIDYYFRVNFDGFKKIIDSLGGVNVNSEFDFNSGKYHYIKGENQLDGEAALAFARNRHSFASGDRQRGKNQMAVIKAVINKAKSPAIIKNYKEILDSLSESFDTSMPYKKICELIQYQIDNNIDWNVTSYSANGNGAMEKPYSQNAIAYVMVPDQETVDKAKELIKQVKLDEIPAV